ncbi:MAG: ATP-dependent DNA helicase [Pseudomonadales bacterium]|nr:ATP-dependent DNA helicase [Pseudomonadales bacterium]
MNDKIEPEYLSTNGAFAQRIPGFVARDAQIKMAQLVAEIISSGGHGIIEAGTGTGKTFAYLLPAMAAGKKIILSTGTKNLQDQVFYKDIPVVNQDYQMKVAMLKGRANYLCPQRLENSLAAINMDSTGEQLELLVRVREWALRSNSGDLTDLFDSEQAGRVMPLVTSTVDNCLRFDCPQFDQCPFYQARARAARADLVVVNHHLLFADLALQEDAASQLWDSAELIIVDEAHQVPDVARQFFGQKVSSGQLLSLAADVLQELKLLGNDDPELQQHGRYLIHQTRQLIDLCQQTLQPLEALLQDLNIQSAIEHIDQALGNLINHLEQVAIRSLVLRNCYRRAIGLADLFALLTDITADNVDHAHWLERSEKRFAFVLSPVDIAAALDPFINHSDKRWLFVSATLTVAASFSHFKKALGLKTRPEGSVLVRRSDQGKLPEQPFSATAGAELKNQGQVDAKDDNDIPVSSDIVLEASFDSPFNYWDQVRGFIPADLPLPGSDEHTMKLLQQALPLIRANSGRTFYLFTSHRALRLTADLLAQEYDIVFLMQGQMAKKSLLEKFSQLPRCVLLASQSFWQGVDVRGADLKCLIIDKLPFPSPSQPVVQAQLRAIEARGGNGFRDYSLPEAAISLKQGFGRLIRQESDQGLFVLGDSRIRSRSYGNMLLSCLPEMQWLQDQGEAQAYIQQLKLMGR